MNNKKEINNGIQKLGEGEENNTSGGYIVKVDPEALREMHLDFKPYLVVDNKTKKILGSYDTKEEAILKDYAQIQPTSSIFDKDDTKTRIFSNGKGEYMCNV